MDRYTHKFRIESTSWDSKHERIYAFLVDKDGMTFCVKLDGWDFEGEAHDPYVDVKDSLRAAMGDEAEGCWWGELEDHATELAQRLRCYQDRDAQERGIMALISDRRALSDASEALLLAEAMSDPVSHACGDRMVEAANESLPEGSAFEVYLDEEAHFSVRLSSAGRSRLLPDVE